MLLKVALGSPHHSGYIRGFRLRDLF